MKNSTNIKSQILKIPMKFHISIKPLFHILIKPLLLLVRFGGYLLLKAGNLLDIIENRIAYDKVLINFFLTFIIPVVLINMPTNTSNSDFILNWKDRALEYLGNGLLFSTTMSVAATYISTYISRVNVETNPSRISKKSENPKIKGYSDDQIEASFKYLSNYSNTLFWAIAILLLSALFLGISNSSQGSLNSPTVFFQILLYAGALITYGYSEKISRDHSSVNSDSVQERNTSDTLRAQKESMEVSSSLPQSLKDRNQK